ncbi:alpha-L-fucosidase [Kineococcus sp. SYSU DK006]|uniref:alpha-L-fucosidase n=1 Tax=Kineococcus sp. SYSU DK006 TaxID=3383127 RepID=UPI003D7E3367
MSSTPPSGQSSTQRDWVPAPVPAPDTAAALAAVRAVVDAGPFTDTWESLAAYEVPQWFRDAKFGVFVHWGVFSVPAFGNEWYPRNSYTPGSREFEHHRAVHGDHADVGYKDFIPRFTMDRLDPAGLAQLFRRAGAQFVVPVAEHHDGIALYDEPRTRWSSVNVGPHRDLLGDVLDACDEQWLVRGASTHRAEHWFFFHPGRSFPSDVRDDAEFADLYGPAMPQSTGPTEAYLEDWLLRTVRIVDRYRPQVLWFDWWIEHPAFEPYLRTLAAYYYNRAAQWGRGVVLQHKWKAFPEGTAVLDVERGSMAGTHPLPWQNDTSVSRTSWGWVEGHEHKSVVDLVGELVDVVAKNGCLLLNIGPKPDGTVPAEEVALLEGVGAWLQLFGEAVYGTRPWTVPGEGPTAVPQGSFTDQRPLGYTFADLRFTQRRDVGSTSVYVLGVVRPEDGVVRVRSFGAASALSPGDVSSVHLIGTPAPLHVERTDDALLVTLPSPLPEAAAAVPGFALRLTVPDPAAPAPRALLLPDMMGGG